MTTQKVSKATAPKVTAPKATVTAPKAPKAPVKAKEPKAPKATAPKAPVKAKEPKAPVKAPVKAKEAQYDENGVKITQSYHIRKHMANGRQAVIAKLADIYQCDSKWAKRRLATYERAYGRLLEVDQLTK